MRKTQKSSSLNAAVKEGFGNAVIIRTSYGDARGGAWGTFAFCVAIVEHLAAETLFHFFSKLVTNLARRIHHTLKASIVEKSDTESARYDLVVSMVDGSVALLRVMQSARFRTNEAISEDDISAALSLVLNRIKHANNGNPTRPRFVIGELRNRGNGLQLSISRLASLKSAPTLVKQIEEAKSGKSSKIELQ